MADKKRNRAVSDFTTYSRFAALEVDDTDSSDDESSATKDEAARLNKNKNKNAKKRDRKKKKAAADVAAINELRSMAFCKTAAPKQKASAGKHDVHHELTGKDEKPPTVPKESLDFWVQQDEQFVVNQFQEDLQEALKQSLGNEMRAPVNQHSQVKKNKKDNTVKLSLDEFQSQPKHTPGNGVVNEMNGLSAQIEGNNESSTDKLKKKKKKNAQKNLQSMEEATGNIQANGQSEKKIEIAQDGGLHASSVALWRIEIDKRDKENESLKNIIEEMKTDLKAVKKRNKQLCVILGQGEMREKSEILLQVEELINIKDEFSTELADMHSSLEQERSKVSALKLELAKHQGARSKKQSTCEAEN